MAGFRERRIMLLILVLLISGIFIYVSGVNFGIDITGGSRIRLRLEGKEATVKFTSLPDNFNEAVKEVRGELENKFHTNVRVLDYGANWVKLLIGKSVKENAVNSVLEEYGVVVEEFKEASYDRYEAVRDNVMHFLELRVDPFGMLHAQFKPLGSKYILFEVPLLLERAKKLLGHTGRLEMFIEDQLVLCGDHIESVGSVRMGLETPGYSVPIKLTNEGAQRFKKYSEGKEHYPFVIYLDRPDDAVLLFVNRPIGLGYEENKFTYPDVQFPFHLQVHALKISYASILPTAKSFMKNRKEMIKRAILLGDLEKFSENVIRGGNLIVDNKTTFPIEEREGFGTGEIMNRVIGVKSWPEIAPGIAGKAEEDVAITGIDDRREAEDLRIILSQRLPVEVSYASEAQLSPRLGKGFKREALKAGFAAFLAVGALVFIRYHRFRIAVPLMSIMLCEVVITLGFSCALPEDIISIGMPEIGGLIAVVGTGVDHQIIITDEILRGGTRKVGRIPIDRRTSRAFGIIFAAAATTIAAMVALAGLGFGAMRGFAIITIIGVLISVLITRPAYARIIGLVLT